MRRPAKAAPLDRGSSYGCHHVVSGLVWLGERRALERGGRGWLRVIHYGGSGEQVSAKPEGPTDGAGGSEHKQLELIQAHIVGIIAAIDAAEPGSFTEVEIPE